MQTNNSKSLQINIYKHSYFKVVTKVVKGLILTVDISKL